MDGQPHIPHFELLKACQKQSCPVCSIVADRAASYLDGLLFEYISDRPFRAAFRSAGGFCAEHAEKLASYRDGLAVAILYEGVLEDRLGELSRGRKEKAAGACPVCLERERYEREYLGYLAEAQRGGELAQAFCAGWGLCLPHYRKLVDWQARRVPAWLREFQEGRYRELGKRARVFIECSAYGRQKDFEALSRQDQLVWKDLVETLRKRP